MEGFGIPILSAFAARCPVILTQASCFPEIAGDAALYFQDGDEEGLRMAVQTILDNHSIRDDLTAKGERRFHNFSWEKCAQETESFYREVLARKRMSGTMAQNNTPSICFE